MFLYDCKLTCEASAAFPELNRYFDNFSDALMDLKHRLNLDVIEPYRQFTLPLGPDDTLVVMCIVIAAYTREELAEAANALPYELKNSFNVIDAKLEVNSTEDDVPLTEAAKGYLAFKYAIYFSQK